MELLALGGQDSLFPSEFYECSVGLRGHTILLGGVGPAIGDSAAMMECT